MTNSLQDNYTTSVENMGDGWMDGRMAWGDERKRYENDKAHETPDRGGNQKKCLTDLLH